MPSSYRERSSVSGEREIYTMKRQQQWILAAAIGVAAMGATACSKPAEEATPPAATTGGKIDSPGASGATAGMPPGMPGMMPGGPYASGGQGGIFGSAPGATPASAPKPLPPYTGPLPGKGIDPFKVTWQKPTPPPPVFATVQPIRLASANITAPPPPNTEIREVPYRRVSGILSGDGVYAILEGGGSEPEIVKPGSRTNDGYRVVSITADSVKLQKRQGNVILTQNVPLSDVQASGPRTAAFGGQGGLRGGQFRGGFPGGPGAFPGGFPGGPGGFPGAFPGGRPGLPGAPGGLPGGAPEPEG